METVNKGSGAGGANTNKNGLSWEAKTNISSCLEEIGNEKLFIRYKIDFREYLWPKSKTGLSKILENMRDKNVKPMHGCKQPDESFIDMSNKKIVILEKKFQNHGGSVCEKLQTVDAKIYNFQKMYPDFEIHYVYCLNDWFKTNCVAELEYLNYKNIKFFWGESEDFRESFCNYLRDL